MPRLTPLPEKVRRAVEAHRLIAPGQPGLVAFSGGPDSLCLLHVLRTLAPELGLDLRAAHVDHGVRRESADEAQRAVRAAAALGVEVSVLGAALERGAPGNLQERARRVRLDLLRAEAGRRGCQWVALGHTASDQAETVLMRAVRGAGLRGLGGMDWRSGLFVRPLLEVTREEVQAHLASHGLASLVVDDPTNESDSYFRNRLRHRVLPILARDNPAVVRALCRLARTCREEDEALTRCARQALDAARLDAAGTIAVEPLRQLSDGLLHRVLRLMFAGASGSLRRLERQHVEAMADLVAAPWAGERRLDLPGLTLVRSYGSLRRAATETSAALRWELQLSAPGSHRLGDGRTLHVSAAGSAALGPTTRLAAARVRFPLVARCPLPGDRIAIAPGQHRKVARLLLDAKIPRADRGRSVVLVSDGGEVVSVVGLRCAVGWASAAGEPELVVTVADESAFPSPG